MLTLRNARREKFAQMLASGKRVTDAHKLAGFKRNDGNASALAKKKKCLRPT